MAPSGLRWRALGCGLADASLVVIVPIVVAAVVGVDVLFILSRDPVLVFGFILPLFGFTVVWGLLDARGHLAGTRRFAQAALQGAVVAAAAYSVMQLAGITSVALAVEPVWPEVGSASAQEWIWFARWAVIDAAQVAAAGAVFALGLSSLNKRLLRVPS